MKKMILPKELVTAKEDGRIRFDARKNRIGETEWFAEVWPGCFMEIPAQSIHPIKIRFELVTFPDWHRDDEEADEVMASLVREADHMGYILTFRASGDGFQLIGLIPQRNFAPWQLDSISEKVQAYNSIVSKHRKKLIWHSCGNRIRKSLAEKNLSCIRS